MFSIFGPLGRLSSRHPPSVRQPLFETSDARYWFLVQPTFESFNELLNMAKTCIDAFAALLEPPHEPLRARAGEAASIFVEALVSPAYQDRRGVG